MGIDTFKLKIINDKVLNLYSFDFRGHAERAVSSIEYSRGYHEQKIVIFLPIYLLPLSSVAGGGKNWL